VFALARVHPGQFVKLRNFAGDVYRQGRRIEAGDTLHTRFSGEKSETKSFFAYTVGADNAHSSDDDPRDHRFLCTERRSGFARKAAAQSKDPYNRIQL
jgi:hypothetical protein